MGRETLDHALHHEPFEITSTVNNVHDPAPEGSVERLGIDGIRDQFFRLATTHEALRARLRDIEKRIIGLRDITGDTELLEGLENDRQGILGAIHENREQFLPVIYELQDQIGIARSVEMLRKWIAEIGGAGKFLEGWTEFDKKMVESTIYNLYMSSVSILEEQGPRRTPSPYESIITTIETRRMANEISDAIKDDTVSVAQAGSGSWGAFFSMRGQAVQDPFDIDALENRDLTMISDVDLIIIVETPDDIISAVEKLVARGFLTSTDLVRAQHFSELYNSGRVDIFSTRGAYNNVEQSYRFIMRTVMDQITDQHPESNTVPVLRDFRSEIPAAYKKYGGYPILGVEGTQIALLKKQPTAFDPDHLELGYLTDSPAGGPISLPEGGKQFALGVLLTQLLYQPDVMHDKDGFLRAQVDKLLTTVAAYLPREEEFRVPRWDRMPNSFRRKLKSSLYERKASTATTASTEEST